MNHDIAGRRGRWERNRPLALLLSLGLSGGAAWSAPAKTAKLTDDEVARWVLSANAGPNFVTFTEAGKPTQVVEASKLPSGKFEVISVAFTSLDQVTPEHLANLSRLNHLGYLEFKDASALTAAGVKALADSLTLNTLIINKTSLSDADLAPLSKIKSLQALVLRECPRLTGDAWQAWRGWGLTSFTFGGWQVTGENLAKLAGLKSLQRLTFDGPSGLKAEDFSGWSHPSVWQLWLTGLPTFTGHLRPVLGAFPRASQVYIHSTPLNAQDCAALAQFRPMQFLQLSGVNVGDPEVAALAASKSMISFECYGLTSAGTSLDQFANCRQLRVLGLFDGQLTDAGLAKLPAVTQIENLTLSGNPAVTNTGLVCLSGMKQLRSLRIFQAGLTNAGLEKLAELRKLESLYVTGCPNVTADGLASLQKALPKCKVTF